ncbi:reverse transcriptase protein [Pleurostoma richardsiae]|uniref:Reverse transcriptase protein n=1 Tax=Pleurostoma richardsiae TaxID=41990 RepID=A0AA38RE64_9PEZI|nr:reverse transcriptase protein [Pleurostoma richardsiae]
MAASGSVFSDTLRDITTTKLDELSRRRADFEQRKAALVLSAKQDDDLVTRLGALSAGLKQIFSLKTDKRGRVESRYPKHARVERELRTLDRFLAQARYDPSVSAKTLGAWEESLLKYLDTQSMKFQFATLYGQLVTEWLSSSGGSGSTQDASGEGDSSQAETFEDVGNARRLSFRMQWEEAVFKPALVDEVQLRSFLNELFGKNGGDTWRQSTFKALKKLREDVAAFESQLSAPGQFTVWSVKWAIQGLLASDLLSDEKREVLKDFKNNDVILTEIADVLNMRIAALESWSWGTSVYVEQRRKISGVYNTHMKEDLLQAIFLQFIGVKWSVFFKKALRDFRKEKTGAWKPLRKDLPKVDQKRLSYYLGPLSAKGCLQDVRKTIHRKEYFLSRLLGSENQTFELVDGEEEAVAMPPPAPAPLRAAMPMMRMVRARAGGPQDQSDAEFVAHDDEDDYDDTSPPKRPMEMKQKLVHLLSTEIAVNTHLHGELTAFRSVFKDWESQLPHETILNILEFFGVSDTWSEFFNRFLETPLKYVDDDVSAPARTRRRGTPTSHALSDLFGEIVLFCLDFAVNQSTDGQVLWRVQDDIWFWSPDHATAVTAWKTVEHFAAVTSTCTNPSKSGTVRISREPDLNLQIDRGLPRGEIRWGFLSLSPRTGRFEIDQEMVEKQIEDLRGQLQEKGNSIFAFIQTWNTYVGTFFSSNFGKPANCFGRDHVDKMLATHEHIQREVFRGSANAPSVADHLKKTIERRFGGTGVPDGFLFFPVELGGLELQSPFITLLQIRDSVLESPEDLFDKLGESERAAYELAKRRFDDRHSPSGPLLGRGGLPRQPRLAADDGGSHDPDLDRDNFMGFEEYVRHREEFDFGHADQVHDVFAQLMEGPGEEPVESSEEVQAAVEALGSQAGLRGITGNWHAMEPYWRWVAAMYGPEVVGTFGGLSIVDGGLLPMGMVRMFRDKRVQWQG